VTAKAKVTIGIDPAKDAKSFTLTDWAKLMDTTKSWADLRPSGDPISPRWPSRVPTLRRVEDSIFGVTPHRDSVDAFSYLYHSQFADQMKVFPSYLDQLQSEPRWSRSAPKYEEMFWRALEESHDDLSPGEWPCIDPTNVFRCDLNPHVIDKWLWGPHGEFVSLARTDHLSHEAQRAAMKSDGRFNYSAPSLGGEVHLDVTTLSGPRRSTVGTGGRGPVQCLLFVRFVDYQSLAIWQAAAMRETPQDGKITGRRAEFVAIDEYAFLKTRIDDKMGRLLGRGA
jgi:hypothetical protein